MTDFRQQSLSEGLLNGLRMPSRLVAIHFALSGRKPVAQHIAPGFRLTSVIIAFYRYVRSQLYDQLGCTIYEFVLRQEYIWHEDQTI